MRDINDPEIKARIEAKKRQKELEREPFIVLIMAVGIYGDGIAMMRGQRTAYVCRLDKLDPPLIPKEGELWLVQTIWKNRHIVLLCPILCMGKASS